MRRPGTSWLSAGAVLSAAAALAHLACIAGGPNWYRFFGAGEPIARAAERGSPIPPLMTAGIAFVLLTWAAFALSGAGLLPRLPFVRTALNGITAIYLARGAMLFDPALMGRADLSPAFLLWSSAIVLVYGVVHAIGTWRAWPFLSNPLPSEKEPA